MGWQFLMLHSTCQFYEHMDNNSGSADRGVFCCTAVIQVR